MADLLSRILYGSVDFYKEKDSDYYCNDKIREIRKIISDGKKDINDYMIEYDLSKSGIDTELNGVLISDIVTILHEYLSGKTSIEVGISGREWNCITFFDQYSITNLGTDIGFVTMNEHLEKHCVNVFKDKEYNQLHYHISILGDNPFSCSISYLNTESGTTYRITYNDRSDKHREELVDKDGTTTIFEFICGELINTRHLERREIVINTEQDNHNQT